MNLDSKMNLRKRIKKSLKMTEKDQKKVRILFFIDQLSLGGTEHYLTQTLRFLDRTRFEPHVYVLHGRYDLLDHIRSLDIPVTRWHIPSIVSLRAILQLRTIVRAMRRGKYDIIHTYLFASNIYGLIAAKLAGIPVRISSRRELMTSKCKKQVIASRVVNWFTQRILVNSNAIKEKVVELEKAPTAKVRIVHNGVDVVRFSPTELNGKFRSFLGVKEADTLIVNIARYRPLKGQIYFVEACAKVAETFPKARFAIVGPVYDKELKRKLQDRSKALGLTGKLFLLPTWQDPVEVYKGSDIIVLSSLEEGFANVILEAMAAAKPVVATRVGGNVEAVLDKKTGFLVPAADSNALANAMGQLTSDKTLAREMGIIGRMRVLEKFQQQNKCQELEKHYLELIKESV